MTDEDGKFIIQAKVGDILVVSSIGQRTFEIEVTENNCYKAEFYKYTGLNYYPKKLKRERKRFVKQYANISRVFIIVAIKNKNSTQQRFTPIAGLALTFFSSVDIWLVFTNLVRKKFCIFVWSVFAAATGVSRDTLAKILNLQNQSKYE